MNWQAYVAVTISLMTVYLIAPSLSAADSPLSAWPPVNSALAPAANGKIAFASNRDGDHEIYVTAVDGGALAKLTNNGADRSLLIVMETRKCT